MARVLLVDDDVVSCHAVRKALEAGNHAVISVHDCEGALSVLDSQPADILVTDVVMPRRNGLELIEAVKRRYPMMKAIAYTGRGARSARILEGARLIGADRTLIKPFSDELLTETVNALCA
jgi:DNA-binding response OmpR family regulator